MSDEFLSIVAVARNEEKFISRFLDSLLNQDYSAEKMEIILADGSSQDKTVSLAEGYADKFPNFKIIANKKRIASSGLNLAIKEARGGIIIRMDVHAHYPNNYLSRLIGGLKEYGADNIGAKIISRPANDSLSAKAVALCLNSVFGSLGSRFRLGSDSPMEVDTVFGGCYKKSVFEKIGYFNENLIRSQDLEFNLRLKKAGGKIIMLPDLVVEYYPKTSLKEFLKHNFSDGFWAVYPLKFIKTNFRPRHYLPLVMVFVSLILMFSGFFLFVSRFLFVVFSLIYFLLNLTFSFSVCLKQKSLKVFPFLVISFVFRHFGYGFGSLWAVLKLSDTNKTKSDLILKI